MVLLERKKKKKFCGMNLLIEDSDEEDGNFIENLIK